MATTIIDTEVKGNRTVYTVETTINKNPLTDKPDFFRFRVVVTEVCPGDPECITAATRCIRSPGGLAAYPSARTRAREFAKRAHLRGMA